MKAVYRWVLALSALCTQVTLAQTFYFLEYKPAYGEQFIGFSGIMHIPELPQAATYYLWPGLQPTDNSGVYQNVLDGRSGTWWIGSGWCCSNPGLPWGGGFNVYEGEKVRFNNTQVNSTDWRSSLKMGKGTKARNLFPLSYKNFNQAAFVIELDGPSWDFGPLAFSDVVITSTGTDPSWCNAYPANYNGATNYTITGVNPVIVGNTVRCEIASVVMNAPA